MTIEEIEKELTDSINNAKGRGLKVDKRRMGVWADKKGDTFEPVGTSTLCAIGSFLLGKKRQLVENSRSNEAAVYFGIDSREVAAIEEGFDGARAYIATFSKSGMEFYEMGKRLQVLKS